MISSKVVDPEAALAEGGHENRRQDDDLGNLEHCEVDLKYLLRALLDVGMECSEMSSQFLCPLIRFPVWMVSADIKEGS